MFLLCFVTLCCVAQNSHADKLQKDVFSEPCGTMFALENQKKNNKGIEKTMLAIEQHTNQILNNKNRVSSKVKEIITIPVIFHIVYKTAAQSLSEERVRSQLDVLNEDFRMQHANVDKTLPIFKDRAADMEIEFCLAQRDPEGLPTTGIQYYSTSIDTFFFDNQESIKFSEFGGADSWPSDDYLNIWVCNLEIGLLGYAQFPGMEKNKDGVVLDYVHVGRVGTQPNIVGRTATHEVGHWLNLRHIWGDGECDDDDDVEDTPPSDTSHGFCNLNADSCTGDDEPDMVQNYMDYTEDRCLTLFTKGQKERARAIFEPGGAREAILSSNSCTPPVLQDDDVRLIQLNNAKANENFCSTMFTPSIQFRNYGNKTLNRLTIETFINENLVDSFDWTGNVATGEFAETKLNEIEFSQGTQELKIVIANVNARPDDQPEDNMVSFNIQALGRSVPFEESFEDNNFPPVYSNLIDLDNDNEGFQLKKGVAYTGDNCMFINCFDYGLSGAIDELVLPLIDFSSTGNPMLEFYNAYARYDSEDSDTLEILVSKDCGQNYTSVYKQQGVFIATAGNRQEYFEPSSENQWRQRIVDLKAFEGESEVSIKFRCINSHEQNLYIDDIRIFGDDMIPVDDDYQLNALEVLIYPNPAIDELNIQLNNINEWKLLVRSVDGKIVLEENDLSKKMNIEHLQSGIYLLEGQAVNRRFSKKLVKL